MGVISVHGLPLQSAPARAFSILNPPSFSHTEGKRGMIVSAGNATSCNFISSSVGGTAGKYDNTAQPSELCAIHSNVHASFILHCTSLRDGNCSETAAIACVLTPPKILSFFSAPQLSAAGSERGWHVLGYGALRSSVPALDPHIPDGND